MSRRPMDSAGADGRYGQPMDGLLRLRLSQAPAHRLTTASLDNPRHCARALRAESLPTAPWTTRRAGPRSAHRTGLPTLPTGPAASRQNYFESFAFVKERVERER